MDVDISEVFLDAGLIRKVGVDFCWAKQCLPLESESFQNRILLTLAMANPADSEIFHEVQEMSSWHVVAVRAPAEEIFERLRKEFPEESPTETPAEPITSGDTVLPPMDEMTRRVVHRLVRIGIERGADELHIAKSGRDIHVRYLIDGRTYRAKCPPGTDLTRLVESIRGEAGIRGSGSGEMSIHLDTESIMASVEAVAGPDGDTLTVRF